MQSLNWINWKKYCVSMTFSHYLYVYVEVNFACFSPYDNWFITLSIQFMKFLMENFYYFYISYDTYKCWGIVKYQNYFQNMFYIEYFSLFLIGSNINNFYEMNNRSLDASKLCRHEPELCKTLKIIATIYKILYYNINFSKANIIWIN